MIKGILSTVNNVSMYASLSFYQFLLVFIVWAYFLIDEEEAQTRASFAYKDSETQDSDVNKQNLL